MLTVKVVLPEPLTEVGEKAAVAPCGRLLTLKATVSLKPPLGDTLIV